MMFTDLPRDLESEILSRVPATSLSKLRSTCKRWCALFKDPRFSKKNFGKGATHVILKKDRVYSVNVNLHGINNSFDPSIEFAGKLNGLKDSQQVDISQMFHCDGLLLCITKDRRLVVWNPCTGQTRWIKRSNHNIDTPYVACFLGYVNNNNNNSCNSYKILRISYNHQQSQVAEFEIYEFNSDSWRLLDDVTYNWSRLSSGVSLNGNTYWVAINRKEPFENKILLKFDFTRERFESLSLPFQTTYLDRTPLLSVVREEKLYLLLERRNTDSLERKIGVTDAKIDEANDTNIKYFLVADLSKFNILKGMNSVTSFLLDEENKMVVCCRRENGNEESTMIYIIGKEGVHVCKQVHGEDYLPLLVSYVPSLVQIQ